MIDKIISGFFAVVTAILSLFYTPSPITQVNPSEIPEAKITQDLTVMTYNVDIKGTGSGSPESRTPLVVEKILSYMPDSFGLEEANEGWVERLSTELADNYAYVGVGRDRDLGGEASPVFYLKNKYELLDSGTFWLSKTPEKPSRGWDAMFNRVCTYAVLKDKETGFTYAHFNAHFDHLGVIARQESIAVITRKIAEIAPSIPVVFSGDLNDDEGTPMYNRAVESGLKDTKFLAETADSGKTYHGNLGGSNEGSPIDFIFTNGYVHSVSSYTIDREQINGMYTSDHHPVIVELTLFN